MGDDERMRLPCPLAAGVARYSCKVAGDCTCEVDDDILPRYEAQMRYRSRPGKRDPWEPTVTSIQDMT